MTDRIRVLFVCTGNICRSPLAEGLFRQVVAEAGLEDRFEIDSAGTSNYHVGDPPDPRTVEVARGRGVMLTHAARQVLREDAPRFDYFIVMDDENERGVRRLLARLEGDGPELHRLRAFDPEAGDDRDVPDPYYGGVRGFEDVHDIVERSARGLLAHIRSTHDL